MTRRRVEFGRYPRYLDAMRSLVAAVIMAPLVCIGAQLVCGASAHARSPYECKTKWAQAVRSYLTQNRKAGPDGKVPTNLDEQEMVAQAWVEIFTPACQIEARGDKPGARIQAALIGAATLAKLDMRGCQRFMQYFMGSERPKDVCDEAKQGEGARLRTVVERSLPSR